MTVELYGTPSLHSLDAAGTNSPRLKRGGLRKTKRLMLTLNQHFELIDFGATLKVANVLKHVVREYVNRKTLAWL